MTPRVLIYLLSSAAAWFASSTDDDLRTWLGDHEPYAAQTEAQARACDATCRASLRQGYRCEGIERPLAPCEFERKPVNADFASLLRATTTPKASCAGPHGAVACYTFGVRAQRPGRARRWRAEERFRDGVSPRRIGGLDGGRVADALHPALPALGLVGCVGLAASGAIANPIFYLILLSGAFQVGGQLFGFSQPPPAHYKMKGGPMIATALAYVGCIGSLVAGMALNNVGRKSPRRIEAEQRGEIIDRAPGHGGDGVYDDYFAEFDDSHSRRDDRWGG